MNTRVSWELNPINETQISTLILRFYGSIATFVSPVDPIDPNVSLTSSLKSTDRIDERLINCEWTIVSVIQSFQSSDYSNQTSERLIWILILSSVVDRWHRWQWGSESHQEVQKTQPTQWDKSNFHMGFSSKYPDIMISYSIAFNQGNIEI